MNEKEEVQDNSNLENFGYIYRRGIYNKSERNTGTNFKLFSETKRISIIKKECVQFENKSNKHIFITYRNILTIEKIKEISAGITGSITGGNINFGIVNNIIKTFDIKSWLYLPPGRCSNIKRAKDDIIFTPYIIDTNKNIKIHGEEILKKGYKYYIDQENVDDAINLNNVLKFKLEDI